MRRDSIWEQAIDITYELRGRMPDARRYNIAEQIGQIMRSRSSYLGAKWIRAVRIAVLELDDEGFMPTGARLDSRAERIYQSM